MGVNGEYHQQYVNIVGYTGGFLSHGGDPSRHHGLSYTESWSDLEKQWFLSENDLQMVRSIHI